MEPAGLLLSTLDALQFVGTSSSPLTPSYICPWAMTLCKWVIAGVDKGGFRPTCFSPHNSLQGATYPFADTVVEVVACPKNFNVLALSGPTIEHDHRSYDIDGASGLTDEICLFQTNDSDLILPNPMVDIYFGSLIGVHRFMPPSLWIRRLTFTSGLYLGSIDSCHLLFISDSSYLLWMIQCLRFTLNNWTVPNFFGTSELWQVPFLACEKP
jgi:hypothetical protein